MSQLLSPVRNYKSQKAIFMDLRVKFRMQLLEVCGFLATYYEYICYSHFRRHLPQRNGAMNSGQSVAEGCEETFV